MSKVQNKKTKRWINVYNKENVFSNSFMELLERKELELTTFSFELFYKIMIQPKCRIKVEFEEYRDTLSFLMLKINDTQTQQNILGLFDYFCFQTACRLQFKQYMCEPVIFAYIGQLIHKYKNLPATEFLSNSDDNSDDNIIIIQQAICNFQTKNELGKIYSIFNL